MPPTFIVIASTLNIRKLPKVTATIVGQLDRDEIVHSSEVSPDQAWLKITKGSVTGWSSLTYLRRTDNDADDGGGNAPSSTLDKILQIANNSAIATYSWKDRGLAPRGYTKGMAVVFAKTYSRLLAGDTYATVMARAATSSTDDVLQHYAPTFKAKGMNNDSSGASTLRHLFVLMMGLGMRESSGEWFTGQDRSAPQNATANAAEAGLFQTSYNFRGFSPLVKQLVDEYKVGNRAGYHGIFNSPPLTPTGHNLTNFGSGDGQEFQRLSKEKPALSVEVATMGSRIKRQHWGPLNTKASEVRPEANTMLLKVQQLVDQEGAPF